MRTCKVGILLFSLSVGGLAALPASAQDNANNRDGITRTADEGFDLGWLGLIGLAGLLGLRRKDESRTHVGGPSRTM